jgi:lipopolysaccharide transport system permease protein
VAGQTVYSSAALLRTPRRLAVAIAADLRVVPATAWCLFVRGLQGRHRQSVLGYLWLLIPALVGTLTWVYLSHSKILRFGETAVPYALYVLAGTLLWQLFVDALNAPLQRLSAAKSVLTKARVPHESWMLAGVLDAGTNFVIRLSLLAVGLAWAGTSAGWELLLAPIGVLAMLVLGVAIGLVLTPIGLLVPDVDQGLRIAIGFWFFLTPVIYPEPDTLLVRLNPVTPVLVTTRSWIVGGGGAAPGPLVLVLVASLVVLVAAWLVYRLAQPHLVAQL